MNNINLEKLRETIEKLKKDPSLRRTKQTISGEWNANDPTKPQFKSIIKTEKGEFTLLADLPLQQGGNMLAPGPIPYCLFGVAACFASTLAMVATLEGKKINKLNLDLIADMNMSRVFALEDAPVIEKVTILVNLEIDGENNKEVLRKLIQLAEERCPAAYTLTHGTKLEVQLA
ncbi:MAG: OsmC family protein [Thermoproteota archaeon]|nr:OsmC family protein [Thermoproteota archaeon]